MIILLLFYELDFVLDSLGKFMCREVIYWGVSEDLSHGFNGTEIIFINE